MKLEVIVAEEEARRMDELARELQVDLSKGGKMRKLKKSLSKARELLEEAFCLLRPLMSEEDKEIMVKGMADIARIFTHWGSHSKTIVYGASMNGVGEAIETARKYLSLFHPTSKVNEYWEVRELR